MRALIYDSLRRASSPVVRRWFKSQRWFQPLSGLLFSDAVYSASYFEDIERIERSSVEHIADWIVSELAPRRAIDVGCGPGHLMEALRQRGVDVYGVDISAAGLERCARKGLRADRFDLTAPHSRLEGAGEYDLAISCEVAEHLPARSAGRFIEHLCEASTTVYLTAATPDGNAGPGLHHVNEQPNEYWIELMRTRGYMLDEAATDRARRTLDRPDVVNYLRRPMLFRRS